MPERKTLVHSCHPKNLLSVELTAAEKKAGADPEQLRKAIMAARLHGVPTEKS